jgi:hypothetical protein
LLSDAFNSAISISLKLKIKPENAPSFQTLMEEDSNMAFELIYLACNIKKKLCVRFFSFILEKI